MTSPRLLVACAATMLLAGCATPPETQAPDTGAQSFAARESQLRSVRNWEMRGRIAVDTGTEEGGWQGRFTWWQDDDSLRLLIRGPLNSRPVEISGNGTELTVRMRRETRVLEDPESQLSDLLGWWLPITSLQSWLLALPDDRFPIAELTLEQARLRTLRQRAWALQYGDYEYQTSAEIPSSIELSHAPLQLVVTIDSWGPRTDPP